jgi:hypothetical protein
MKSLLLFVSMSIAIISCTSKSKEAILADTSCDTNNTKFGGVINPIFTTSCATSNCHAGAQPSAGLDLSNYTQIAANAENCLSRMKNTGDPMPPTGKLDNCKIIQLEKWIGKGKQNN